jgi:hypothetical protein
MARFGIGLGFALGLGVGCATGARPEVALFRGLCCAFGTGLAGILAGALNSKPETDDKRSDETASP